MISPREILAKIRLVTNPKPEIPNPAKGNQAGSCGPGVLCNDQKAPIDQRTPNATKTCMNIRVKLAAPKVPIKTTVPFASTKRPINTGFHELRNIGITRSRQTAEADTRPNMYSVTLNSFRELSVVAASRAIASSNVDFTSNLAGCRSSRSWRYHTVSMPANDEVERCGSAPTTNEDA
jgi:hypothetical protein